MDSAKLTDASNTVESLNDTLLQGEAPIIDPDTLIGFSFVGKQNGVEMKKTVKSYDEDTNEFELKTPMGGTEWMAYNRLIQEYNEENDAEEQFWAFNKIRAHRTKKGRIEVQVEWTTGEITWEPMNIIRMSDPLTLARYAKENALTSERGWKWASKIQTNIEKVVRSVTATSSETKQGSAFTSTQKKKKPMKTKQRGPKFKFGVEIPRGTKHALLVDKANGNTLWEEAMNKEAKGLLDFHTFKILNENERPPQGYHFVPLHACYNCKVDGRRKCRIVANGGMAPIPVDNDLYAGVVTIDVVRLLVLVGIVNDLEIIATDISQAYLHGVTREKLYTRAGPEFGKEVEGRLVLIHKAIYGLISSSGIFHEVLSDTLRQMGWSPSYADPNVWIKDCGTHYEYIATWVDDLLIFSKNAMEIIKQLEKRYELKGTGVPEYYLGGNIEEIDWKQSPKGKTYALSARTYIKNITEKIEKMFETELRHSQSPMDSSYKPEIDETELLSGIEVTKYQMLIGCGNWVITLGRYDVNYAVSTLARYNVAPRAGHMRAMLRVFGYLKHYNKWKITIDPSILPVNEEDFKERKWDELYPGIKEELPHNMPDPKGNGIKLTGYFDADHASDVVSRRSVTGVLMFANSTPVRWWCKRQNCVETSTYGSEIVASRIAIDIAIEMRYKLRMLGIPVIGPVDLYGDNQSVIANTTVPTSVTKKKHNAVSFHRTREAVAAGIVRITYVASQKNLSDALTKALGPTVYERLVKPLFNRREGDDLQGEC